MVRKIARTLVRALLVAAVLLTTLEVSARVFNALVYHTGPRRAFAERERFLARLPAAHGGAQNVDPGRRRFVDMAYGSRYELHPFFGYTFFRDFEFANNQGFLTDQTYPYRKRAGEYVVGIFGGSVAMQLAAASEPLRTRLLPALRAKGYTTVTVLPFAIGAWRQPQSFFALVYYLDTIDLAIDLDGFNEAVGLWAEQIARYPARFPPVDVYPTLAARDTSAYQARDAAVLSMLGDMAASATTVLQRRPLRFSLLAHSIWRAGAAQYDRYASRVRKRMQGSTADEWKGIDRYLGDGGARVDAYNRFYGDVIRDADAITRLHGKPFFHFIQPNQYDRESKPLSAEERTQYTGNNWWDQVTPEYRRLDAMSDELRRSGVDSTSLTRLFADVHETVYADACCHFNAKGLRRIGEAVADHILASGPL